MTRTTIRGARPRWHAVLGTTLVAALALTAAGCSGADDSSAGSPPASTESGAPAESARPSKVVIGKVRGTLEPAVRKKVVAQVGASVDTWFDGAFVAGDYPRSDFGEAFAAFTPGAAARARQAGTLMSNRSIGETIESIEATKRTVRVDVLAAKGQPAGITAHVVLGVDIAGDQDRSERIAGRLFLAKDKGAWAVFGFDMTRGRA